MKINKNLKRGVLVSLCLCAVLLCVWCMPASAAGVDNANVSSLEEQIADLELKQQEAYQKIEEAQQNIDDIMELKLAYDESIQYTARKIAAIEALIAELETQISETAKLVTVTEENIKTQREAFLARMVALHEDGDASYLEYILGSEDIATFLARYDYISSVMEYDKEVMAELRESKQILEKAREEKEASLETQKLAMAQLEEEKTYYNSMSTSSESLLAEAQKDKENWESVAAQAAAAEKELDEKLQAELLEIQRQQELAAQQQQEQQNQQNNTTVPNVYAEGEYAWPVPPEGTYISSSFGNRTLNGYADWHGATDIAAATGTPVYAANDGTVIRSEWHDSYGNYILIDHGNGFATLYAHLSSRGVSAGQVVSRTDYIGAVGNTGYSFGSHLHFEFRVNGERVDPVGYVSSPY